MCNVDFKKKKWNFFVFYFKVLTKVIYFKYFLIVPFFKCWRWRQDMTFDAQNYILIEGSRTLTLIEPCVVKVDLAKFDPILQENL
jgi:hypothetical protein